MRKNSNCDKNKSVNARTCRPHTPRTQRVGCCGTSNDDADGRDATNVIDDEVRDDDSGTVDDVARDKDDAEVAAEPDDEAD
jgi:hypothetical protein